MQRLLPLDGIRGLASLGVVILHLSGTFYGYPFLAGTLLVDLFFILSGVVLSYVYSAKISKGTISFGTFISHRLLRLYPVHLLVLLVALLVVYLYYPDSWWVAITKPHLQRIGINMNALNPGPHAFSISVLLNLFLLQNVGYQTVTTLPNFPAWSISVEFAINLVWLWLLWFTRNSSKIRLGTYFTLIVLALYYFISIKVISFDIWHGIIMGYLDIGVCRGILGFFLGCLLYQFIQVNPCIPNKCLTNLFSIVIVLSIGGCLIPYIFHKYSSYGSSLGCVAILFPTLIYLALQPGWLSQLLSTKLLTWLGAISYSLYLWHMVIVHFLLGQFPQYFPTKPNPTQALLPFWLSFIACLAISSLSYYLFEKPVRDSLRKLLDRS